MDEMKHKPVRKRPPNSKVNQCALPVRQQWSDFITLIIKHYMVKCALLPRPHTMTLIILCTFWWLNTFDASFRASHLLFSVVTILEKFCKKLWMFLHIQLFGNLLQR